MPDITYDVGRASFIMKGAWNFATNYEKLDAVSYNGSLYIAKQDVPGGTSITNTTYWQLAAEKGDKGDTGGVDSVNGQQGDIWFPDSRQLISDGYTTDTEPFLMKGNDSDSDRFELAKKLGNTVCVNQLVQNGDFSGGTTGWTSYSSALSVSSGVATLTFNTVGTVNILLRRSMSNTANGHTVLVLASCNPSSANVFRVRYPFVSSSVAIAANVWTNIAIIGTAGSDSSFGINTNGTSVGATLQVKNLSLIDLTLWFGSNDRIPSNLLSHPENWGRYYAGSLAYAAGYLDSADGTVMKSIGRNVWDEEWRRASLDTSNGTWSAIGTYSQIASTNYIPVLPNTAYYENNAMFVAKYDAEKNYIGYVVLTSPNTFTTDANCRYIMFQMYNYGTTYLNNITISLYYSGESGYDQYYPYSVLAEVDTGSEVLRSAGSVADEKTPDGTITRRVGVVDLGTLTWVYSSSRAFFQVSAAVPGVPVGGSGGKANAHCAKYAIVTNGEVASTDKTMAVGAYYASGCNIYVKDSTYGTDAAAFKTAMSGVYLYYELATPTTEQGTAFAPIVATVKGGELSWTNTKGIPVGQESHWFENLRKRVEDRLPDPPSADGTYRLTCTISGGVKTYSWEA